MWSAMFTSVMTMVAVLKHVQQTIDTQINSFDVSLAIAKVLYTHKHIHFSLQWIKIIHKFPAYLNLRKKKTLQINKQTNERVIFFFGFLLWWFSNLLSIFVFILFHFVPRSLAYIRVHEECNSFFTLFASSSVHTAHCTLVENL